MPPSDPHGASRAAIAWRVLGILTAGILMAGTLALLEPKNDVAVTVAFYGPLLAVVAGIAGLLRSGRTALAGWMLSAAFFLATLAGTLVVGTITTQGGASYVVCVMVAAATLGRRPAAGFTFASVAALTAVAVLEHFGGLPQAVSPSSSILNSWVALAVPLLMSAYLLHLSLREMEKAVDVALRRQSERDAAQEKLVQSQKLEVVGRLTAGIAHDFNNLLTVILGSTELLRLDDTNDAELLDGIEDAGRRASLLTSRLLAFGRPHELQPHLIELGPAVLDIGPLLQRLVGDEIHVDVKADVKGAVMIDTVALEQIVLNLVINAKEAIAGSGTIEVGVSDEPATLALTVDDTGPGIARDDHERIFEPFHTTKTTGTGLGLATVHSLVSQVGATIEVGDSPLGGARFVIHFPRVGAATERGRSARTSSSVPRSLRVLLVEDEDMVLAATTAGLKARGWSVTQARDGLEALSKLERGSFDVLITDNAMHGMMGIELARRARERDAALPILLVSGNPVDADLPSGAEFLAKPYGQEELVRTVTRLLERVSREVHDSDAG